MSYLSDGLSVDGPAWTPPTLEQWREGQKVGPKQERPKPADLAKAIKPPKRVAWMADAACRDHPRPHIFFPARGHVSVEALECCDRCPVRGACLEYGLTAVGVRDPGIYGGVTQFGRRGQRKKAS